MYNVLVNFPKQLVEGKKLGSDIKLDGQYNKILVAGMGGSAIPGDLLRCYLKKIPVFIHRDYDLPEWIDKNTLIFCISYSGNTEETLSAYRSVLGKNLTAVSISAGGKLEEITRKGYHIKVPSGIQPRQATGYLFMSMINVLRNNNIIKDDIDAEQVASALSNPALRERAQEIAEKINNRCPIIYSSNQNYCIARIWKIAINENAKIPAFWNTLPEMNHNEIVSYTNLLENKYFAIFIADDEDNKRVKDRILITKRLIKEKVEFTELRLSGQNRLQKLMIGIYLGHWVGYFMAIKLGIDPTPVEMVEELKKELGKII